MQRDNLVDHTENGEILLKLIADKREVDDRLLAFQERLAKRRD
jgi:hypothetical protein